MDLTAINGEVISGNGSGYIPKEADVVFGEKFYDPDGELYTEDDMPDFEVDFFVYNRETEKVTCSCEDGITDKCKILIDGTVQFFIPGGSFTVGDTLYYKVSMNLPNANFLDGIQNDIVTIKTKYRIV